MTSAIERAVAAIGPERFLGSLTTQEQQALAYQWRLWARPSQLPPPGEWSMTRGGQGCMGSSVEHMNKPTTETRELSESSNPIKRYIGRAGQLRYKVAPWMMDRQVAHIPVGLAISWLVFLWPLDVAASVLWGARLTAVMLFFGFILYEVTEDQEINDQAYRDIQGFVIGLGIGALAQVLLTSFVG